MTSLPLILNDLPPPLGYHKTKKGKLMDVDHDTYASELLIRAELNMCMRHNSAEKEEEESKRGTAGRYFKKPEIKQVFTNGVDYETLISTIVFW